MDSSMWEQVFDLAINNGLWAVMFCLLLIYQLKDSKSREMKYQQTIYDLNKSLTTVNTIEKSVKVIDSNVKTIGSNVINIDKKLKKMSVTLNVEDKQKRVIDKSNIIK